MLCTWWAKSHNKGETICFSWRETSKVRLHSIIIFKKKRFTNFLGFELEFRSEFQNFRDCLLFE